MLVQTAIIFCAITAGAVDLTWSGSISTDWTNSANWNPQQVPTASDHVIIGSGSIVIPVDAAFGSMDWSGGNIYGSLSLATNVALNINGSGFKNLLGPITNSGTIVFSGAGQWQVAYGPPDYYGAIFNEPGALFNLQSDALLSAYNGNEIFNNAGTLLKSAGSGTSTLNLQLNNTGIVQVQSGNLSLGKGGSLAGQFTANAGTMLLLSGGNFVQSGTPIFSGGGSSQFLNGTLTLANDIIPGLALDGGTLVLGPGFQGGSITNLTTTGSTLNGTYTVKGVLNWGGGILYGALTVASNGVLNITGTGFKNLQGPLTNSGTIVFSGPGQWQVAYGPPNYYGAIYNQPGALLDLQSDALISAYSGNEAFNNAGTLRKSGGSGTSTINLQVSNASGTVEADTGILSLNGGYLGSGNPNLAFSLGGALAGSGYGQIAIAGQLVLSGSLTATTRNAYRPNAGDSFQVLTYASVTGAPGCLGLDLGGGLLLRPQFGAKAMDLLVTTYPTNATLPALSIAAALGGLLLTWPPGFPGWTLQGTTNLTSHFWTTVPSPCGNQALIPTATPHQYFRLVSPN